MSGEAKFSYTLAIDKGNISINEGVSSKSIDVAGSILVHKTQGLSTSEEALVMGDLTAPGLGIFRNNSTTAGEIIYLRQATGAGNFIAILPGEEWPMRFSQATTAPFAIAAAGTPQLEYWLLEV